MEISVILDKLTPIYREIFDDEEVTATMELTALDVAEWDSLSHIRMILTVEEEFSIKLTPNESTEFKNTGDLVSLIQTKTKN